MNFDLEYHKIMFEGFNSSIKLKKKQIKWSIALFALYIFNTILNIFNVIRYYDKISLFLLYIFCVIIWITLSIWAYKKFKKEKIELKEYEIKQMEELKLIDYPKYIKEQRTLKLKKLKTI